MGALRQKYPEELSAVIRHARRLAEVLEVLEARPATSRWFVGRAGELRTLVGSVVADWKAGRRDTEQTNESVRSFVDSLHRGAARRLRSRAAFACCQADEAITAVGDCWSITSLTRADSVATALSIACAHTARGGCLDGPEVIARFEAELDRVEFSARMVSGRIRTGRVTIDDLRAFGREGLLDAARTFEEHRGVPFGAWAAIRIRGAILDGLSQWGSIPRRLMRELKALEARQWELRAQNDRDAPGEAAPSSTREGFAFTAFQPDDGCAISIIDPKRTPEDALAKAQVVARLRELVEQLPKEERELVEGCYWAGQTVEQVSARLGKTRSWGSRKLSWAIESMRRELERGQ